MHTFDTIVTFPFCAGLTAAGLVLSWLVWRKGGARRGTRAAGWAVLPLAVWLVGAVSLVGRLGSAVVRFAAGFVFSPTRWAGIGLLAVAVLILLSTGGLPALRPRKARDKRKLDRSAARTDSIAPDSTAPDSTALPVGTGRAGKPSRFRKGGTAAAADDELGDVADILRRHGIK